MSDAGVFYSVEIGLTVLAFVLALGLGHRGHWLARLWKSLGRFAAHRRLTLLTIGLTSLLANVIMAQVRGIPDPLCTDEYSYLLAAKTFSQGRLTNPSPPFPEHFQAPHILVRPSYQSIYPPAQSLSLALGELAGGQPILGVWLMMALASASTCWMLQAHVPPRWALLGGLICALNPLLIYHWGQSYWGGGVAMTGGALVFGGVRRVIESQRVRDALLLGLGLALLASSRPYEGFVAAVPVAGLLLVWLVRRGGRDRALVLRNVGLPILICLLLTAAWIGLHNYRVTGDPLRLPYQLAEVNRGSAPPLSSIVVSVGSPLRGGISDWVENARLKLMRFWRGFLGIPLTIALLVLPQMLRDRWMQFALLCVLLVLTAILIELSYGYAHYAAPVVPLIYLLVTQGFRRLALTWEYGTARGRALVLGLCLAYFVSAAVVLFPLNARWYEPEKYPSRAPILAQLEATEGRHLVFVRYPARQTRSVDWVYNEPDIENGRVLWVRALTTESDRQVAEFFTGRHVWLLEAGVSPARLMPHPGFGKAVKDDILGPPREAHRIGER